MLNSIWGIIAVPLGYIMKYCYQFFKDILNLPLAYVWALLLFTIITKALLFPLSLKQQKSTAKMAAITPLMDEIKKTYAKDQRKQQEAMAKLQEEMGYNPLSGCLPLLIQFPIIFGLVEVIYKPLTYMLTIPKDIVAKLTELLGTVPANQARYVETKIIEMVQNPDNASRLGGIANEWIAKIQDLDMSIGSINLWDTPSIKEPSLLWLIPIFSVVTMLLSSLISMKTSGNADVQGAGQAKTMTITMSLMFAVFSFMYPAGFSLYWGFSNLVIIGQSFLLKKLVDPAKLKAQALAEMEEKKKSAKKKNKKVVKVKDEKTGEIVEKEITAAELERLRLQKARELKDSPYDS